MNPIVILLVVLLVAVFAGAPGLGVWQHGMGYYPSGLLGLIFLVLLILFLLGKL